MFPLRSTVPVRHLAVVTWALMAVNAIVFVHEAGLSPQDLAGFLARFALIPAQGWFGATSGAGALLPYFTNTFLHGSWLHLVLNMWTLWLFGPAVEDRLGPWRFLVFYGACGVLASLAHAASDPTSMVPVLGASGAIAGVLGSYTLMFPAARIVVLVPIVFVPLFFSIPAIVFTGLWFVSQIVSGTGQLLMPHGAGGIAWWAHIGGFVAGLALTPLLRLPPDVRRPDYGDESVLGFAPPSPRRPSGRTLRP